MDEPTQIRWGWCLLESDRRVLGFHSDRRLGNDGWIDVGSSANRVRPGRHCAFGLPALPAVYPRVWKLHAREYYVGFRVGDQEIGLDPYGHNKAKR